jgi:thiol:disulfide interchange protein
MNGMQQFRYIFILIAIVSIQACTRKSADGGGATNHTAPNANALEKVGWLNNLNEAQTQSVKAQKPILVNFTNSDTCGLCKQMNTNVFSTPTFKAWAEKYVVLLEVDFSAKNPLPENNKNQNAAMAQSLKVNSYPTIWILNIAHEPANNRFKVKPVGTIGYQETPEKFIGLLQNLIRR